jgi:hypothetical protein
MGFRRVAIEKASFVGTRAIFLEQRSERSEASDKAGNDNGGSDV